MTSDDLRWPMMTERQKDKKKKNRKTKRQKDRNTKIQKFEDRNINLNFELL